jgi:hypothetical protein
MTLLILPRSALRRRIISRKTSPAFGTGSCRFSCSRRESSFTCSSRAGCRW